MFKWLSLVIKMFESLRTLINKRLTFVRRLYRNEVYAAYAYSLLWSEKLHREDGPAYVENYHNGSVKYQAYYRYNIKHREDGPASIYYHDNGNISSCYYYKNGFSHREDGPAYISYHDNRDVMYIEYYLNDELLNEQGWFSKVSTQSKLNFLLKLDDLTNTQKGKSTCS